MFIQIHTDKQIDDRRREAGIEDRVRERLGRFADRLTHVEIHVTDSNGGKGASDLRATLEARVNGLDPVAVTEDGTSIDRVVLGAVGKAARVLDHKLGRLSDRAKAAPAS